MKRSKIALGCDSRPFHKGEDITPIMDECMKLGLNVFDSARGYGESERVLGEYIRSHGKREDYFVSTKGCLPYPFSRLNPRALVSDLEESLATLDIGYIDLYLLHRDSLKANIDEILEILYRYQSEGKILHYGVSNWKLDRVKMFNALALSKGYDPIYCVSNAYSLVPWQKDPWGGGAGCVCSTGNQEEINYYSANGTMFLAYSPLARGFLTGKVKSNDRKSLAVLDASSKRAYLCEENLARLARIEEIASRLNTDVPTLTIAYLCQCKMHIVPSFGTTSVNRIAANMKAAEFPLDSKTIEELDQLIKR